MPAGRALVLAALVTACSGPASSSPPAAPRAEISRASEPVASDTSSEEREGSAPEPAFPATAPRDREGEGSREAREPSPEPAGSRAAACPPADRIPDGMACVRGGAFVRGTDDGPALERPAAEVFVSTFLMDTHEVTNALYRECVEARVCQRVVRFPGYMGDTQPVVAMRWDDADAYCRWRGKRLPTEAEWERAASGPDDTRFPWGDAVPTGDPCELAIVRVRAGRGCGAEVTWPVGSRAPGPWGLYDMAGNVWEWVADHHSRCYAGCRRECGDACLGDDPRGFCGDPHAPCPEALGQRTVRGGSWWHDVEHATTTYRRGVPGSNPNPHRFGFRCARDLDGSATGAQ